MNPHDPNNSANPADPSEAFLGRKEAILRDVLAAARRRRRVRSAVRTALPVAAVCLLVAVMMRGGSDTSHTAPRQQARSTQTAPSPEPNQNLAVESASRPTINASRGAITVASVDDEEFLRLLRENGRPAGLARIGDRVEVVFHQKRK